MAVRKDIKSILRTNKPKLLKKEKVKISNPIDFRSFIPLLIILMVVFFAGYKIIFNLKKNKAPDIASIINSGIKDIENNNIDEAVKKFEGVLEKDANNNEAFYNLAVIKYIKGQYDDAIFDLDKL